VKGGKVKKLVFSLLRYPGFEAMAKGLQAIARVWGRGTAFDFSLSVKSARSGKVALGTGADFGEGG